MLDVAGAAFIHDTLSVKAVAGSTPVVPSNILFSYKDVLRGFTVDRRLR